MRVVICRLPAARRPPRQRRAWGHCPGCSIALPQFATWRELEGSQLTCSIYFVRCWLGQLGICATKLVSRLTPAPIGRPTVGVR